MELFSKLGINPNILRVIAEERFEKPTLIQEKAIPLVLQGKDILGGSATGSGKTLVFASGILQNAKRGAGIQALILTPTRELAEQVGKEIRKFSKYQPLNITSIYGGVSINPQIDALRRADVVIGTPGRILDHIDRRTIMLRGIKTLVLDEADRMLDMGFIDDVEKIIRECPKVRQTLLFSATIPNEIANIAHRYMNNPIKVSAETFVDPRKLTQVYYNVQDGLKFSLLVHLLKQERTGLVMVFCNTQRNTDFVANNLKQMGIEAMAIHGGLSQDKRTRTIGDFHAQKVEVLVCTDVAARGLDIKGVSHVYNYDIPKESKQYIHRIGRTARAGKEGKAINILASADYDNFSRVLRDNSVEIPKEETPQIEQVRIYWKEKPRFRRGFQRPGQGGFGRPRDDRGPRRGPARREGQSAPRPSGSISNASRRQRRF